MVSDRGLYRSAAAARGLVRCSARAWAPGLTDRRRHFRLVVCLTAHPLPRPRFMRSRGTLQRLSPNLAKCRMPYYGLFSLNRSSARHFWCGVVLGRRRFYRPACLPSGLRPWACMPFLCCQAPRPLALPSASPSPLALPSALHMRCYAPRLRLAPPSAVPTPCAAERFVPRASLPLRAAERCLPWSLRL